MALTSYFPSILAWRQECASGLPSLYALGCNSSFFPNKSILVTKTPSRYYFSVRTNTAHQLPIGILMYPKGPPGDHWHLSKDRLKERKRRDSGKSAEGNQNPFMPPTTLSTPPSVLEGRHAAGCHTPQNLLVQPWIIPFFHWVTSNVILLFSIYDHDKQKHVKIHYGI